MRLVLVFGRDDPARVRFAISPMWETMVALRVLREPHRRSYHLPWLDLVRPDLDRLDLWPLLVLSPRTGWSPDFLSPAPAGPGTDIADQVVRENAGKWESVSERDLERVQAIARTIVNRLLHEPTTRMKELRDDRVHARMALVRDLFGLKVDERSYAATADDALAEVHELPPRGARRR